MASAVPSHGFPFLHPTLPFVPMKPRAAVAWKAGQPLSLETDVLMKRGESIRTVVEH